MEEGRAEIAAARESRCTAALWWPRCRYVGGGRAARALAREQPFLMVGSPSCRSRPELLASVLEKQQLLQDQADAYMNS